MSVLEQARQRKMQQEQARQRDFVPVYDEGLAAELAGYGEAHAMRRIPQPANRPKREYTAEEFKRMAAEEQRKMDELIRLEEMSRGEANRPVYIGR